MRFFDHVSAGEARRTADGYLVADARAARTGIQEYLGAELGAPDKAIVRVYRPADEVFSRDSLASYAHKPATNDHPAEQVTAANWKTHSIGQIGDDIVRDGDHVRVPLILMDSQAIADYERGKRDLSMGYEAEIVFQDGVTPEGEPYDAIQKGIRINHIALVDRGRAGSTRIGDTRSSGVLDHAHQSKTGGHPMADTLRKVIIDGLTIETTEQGEQAISKLQKQIADSARTLADAEAKHVKAIADKDAELAKKDAEIDDLKTKVLSDADLDKRVQERADLITQAKAIADGDYAGLSDAEIKTAVVKAKFGDAAIQGKSPEYINARFDILAEQGTPDPVRAALGDRSTMTTVKDNGYAESVAAFNRTKKEA